MASQLHLGEVALADGLQQTVVTDVRLVVGRRGNRVAASRHAGPPARLGVAVRLGEEG